MRLKGAVVVVTGASSGIGAASAIAFARAGARLELGARRLDRLGAVADRCRAAGSAVYSATKHAIVGLSHALRGELSGTGVKVCVVYPGVTAGTEFFKDPDRPVGWQYPASWVANLIVRTARYPRRDAMVFPLRLAHLAEPVFGGLMDHALGEIRRRDLPD